MSIESRLYDDLYDGFEKKTQRVRTLRAENNEEKLATIEKKYEKMGKRIKLVRNGLYAASIGSLGLLYYTINNPNNSSDIDTHFGGCLSVMTPLLATHFHHACKLEEQLVNKILGRDSNGIDEKKIRKWEKIGRFTHLSAVACFLTTLSVPAYETMIASPILGGALIGLGGFAYYHNFIEGYSALYHSMADFILGEKRKKRN